MTGIQGHNRKRPPAVPPTPLVCVRCNRPIAPGRHKAFVFREGWVHRTCLRTKR